MGRADRHWRELSFDELPALRMRRKSLRSALSRVTVAWMFGIAWISAIAGSQMTIFCRFLGFGYYEFGLLSAIPYAATLGQLYAAAYVERTGVRKYQFIYFALVHRALWLLIAAIPLIFGVGAAGGHAFLIVFAVSTVLGHASTPGWQTWMGDLVPRRVRGRYFANRNLWTLPIQVIVALTAGFLMDRVAAPGADPGHQPRTLLWLICGIFAVGSISGIIDILVFVRLREIFTRPLVSPDHASRRRVLETMLEPLHMLAQAFGDRVFRHYALYSASIAFSITISEQFFWLNALEDVGFGRLGTNALFLGVGPVAAMVMARPWGALIDRWGRRPMLILASLVAAFSPLGWLLMVPGQTTTNYLLGIASCFVGGGIWSAIGLAQTSVMLGFSESTGRSRYMAAAAVVTAIGGFLGGLTGAQVAQGFVFLRQTPLALGHVRWTNYHMVILAAMLVRGLSGLWLVGMPDPGARPVGYVVRTLTFNVYSNVKTFLSWPLRILRRPFDDDHTPPT